MINHKTAFAAATNCIGTKSATCVDAAYIDLRRLVKEYFDSTEKPAPSAFSKEAMVAYELHKQIRAAIGEDNV